MKGLLIKDFYILKKSMKVYLVLFLGMAVIPSHYFQLFAIVYAALLNSTVIAYDEQSRWSELAAMMPYSVGELVLSKYVLNWSCTLGTGLLAWAAGVIERPYFAQAARLELVLMGVGLSLLTTAVTLPFLFRFGSARGRQILTTAIVILACGGAGLLSGMMEDGVGITLLSHLSLLLPLAGLAASVLSVPVSMAVYRKRAAS